MKSKKLHYLLQIVKTILFMIFIYSLIKLIPTMFNIGIIGIIFLIISIIYTFSEVFVFLIKDEKINNSVLKNLLNIIIYTYIGLIASRYINSVNSMRYVLDDLYFKINYIIAIIGMLGIIFNTITLITETKEKRL